VSNSVRLLPPKTTKAPVAVPTGAFRDFRKGCLEQPFPLERLFRQSDIQTRLTGDRRARASVACGADAPEANTRRDAGRSMNLCFMRVWMHKGRAVYS